MLAAGREQSFQDGAAAKEESRKELERTLQNVKVEDGSDNANLAN
jgi:hypothetical protein